MKFFRPKNQKAGFTLVEIMIVVLIIGILLAIAIPNFVSARESARAKSCVGNLKQLDSATQQYCMDKKLNASNYVASMPTIDSNATTGLVGTAGYLRTTPACPSSGTYVVAPTISDSPYCTISGQAKNATPVAATNTDPNYAAGAKFYHGL
jgi:type II secretion system protein G